MASSALARGVPEILGRVKFVDFMPDADPLTPGALLDVANLYPTTKGYRAYPSLAIRSVDALPGPSLGASAGVLGSAVFLVAGTSNQLFLLNQSALTWTNQGLGLSTITGRWRFDANMRKQFRVAESRSLGFRVDASNVFNHPEPANPTLDINSATPFGNISTKTFISIT